MHDRVVDHLAVDLDRRRAAALGFAEGADDALGGGQLGSARHIGGVHRRDLVGMHAAASLEAAAAAALERARKGLGLLEMEPGTVDRVFHARGARGEHDAGTCVVELGLIERRRKPEIIRVIAGAEANPLHAPGRSIGTQVPRLHDAVDALHPRRGLDLRHEIERAFLDAALALERGEQPVDGVQIGGAFDFRHHHAVHAFLHRGDEIGIAIRRRRRVHAHVEQAAPRLGQCLDHGSAARRLVGGSNRVLEIEDHGVGVQRERFLDAARHVGRREQERADHRRRWRSLQAANGRMARSPASASGHTGRARPFTIWVSAGLMPSCAPFAGSTR